MPVTVRDMRVLSYDGQFVFEAGEDELGNSRSTLSPVLHAAHAVIIQPRLLDTHKSRPLGCWPSPWPVPYRCSRRRLARRQAPWSTGQQLLRTGITAGRADWGGSGRRRG